MAKVKSLAEKMLIKVGQSVEIVGMPTNLVEAFESVARAKSVSSAEVVLLFAANRKGLEKELPKIVKEGTQRRIWIAYPKAGQLGTDLNRDVLHGLGESMGLNAVRQIALDEVWSALAFFPARAK